MNQDISIRKAETGDIGQIKKILFSALKEYKIALPDNYAATDIESIDEAVSLYKKFGFMEVKAVEKSPGHDLAFEKSL